MYVYGGWSVYGSMAGPDWTEAEGEGREGRCSSLVALGWLSGGLLPLGEAGVVHGYIIPPRIDTPPYQVGAWVAEKGVARSRLPYI